MRRLLLLLALPPVIAVACGGPPSPDPPPHPGLAPSALAPPSAAPTASAAEVDAGASADASAEADAGAAAADGGAEGGAVEGAGPCPTDMVFVDGNYCTKVERTCLRKELNKPNHLEICHSFAHQTRCVGKEEKHTFCIDKYEYPNRQGGHPAWMVSWWDAEATCRSKGKRLCYASEWTMACEGPERLPFPYGWDRDQTACNIDNVYINPHLSQAYSSNPEASQRELSRLDQSVRSGALERCKSGYGVHDMTGNMDEWVTRDDKPRADDKGKWAALKGGAWGHVRNACRPMTTSHSPEFTYYFISFRCCADAQGYPAYRPENGPAVPEVKPADKAPEPEPKDPPGPSKQKVQPENRGGLEGHVRRTKVGGRASLEYG